jgi:hypothetical protein
MWWVAYGVDTERKAHAPRSGQIKVKHFPNNEEATTFYEECISNEALPQTDEACGGCGSDRRLMTSLW